MKKAKITIRNDQRTLVIGAPGDGKTTLALNLLKILKPDPLVILNPGADEELYRIFGESKTKIDTNFPSVQHVTPMVTENPKTYGSVLWPILQQGNVYSFIDELAIMGEANRYSIALKYMYQMGRRRANGVMACTQRTLQIPKFCFSFSEHFFVGHVEGADLKRLEEGTGKKWGHLIQRRTKHQFAYWGRNTGEDPQFIN